MRMMIVKGFVGRDAALRTTKNGNNCIEFSLGNNEFGDEEGKACWFKVTSFQPNCINMHKYLTKGKGLIVTGRYNDRIYFRQDGTPEIDREIIASMIEFANDGTKKNDSEATQTPPEAVKPQDIPVVTQTVKNATQATQTPVAANSEDDDLPF